MRKTVETVILEIRAKILNDVRFRPGIIMPSGRSLEKELGAARMTVQKAIRRLLEEGWLERSMDGLSVAGEGWRPGTRTSREKQLVIYRATIGQICADAAEAQSEQRLTDEEILKGYDLFFRLITLLTNLQFNDRYRLKYVPGVLRELQFQIHKMSCQPSLEGFVRYQWGEIERLFTNDLFFLHRHSKHRVRLEEALYRCLDAIEYGRVEEARNAGQSYGAALGAAVPGPLWDGDLGTLGPISGPWWPKVEIEYPRRVIKVQVPNVPDRE